MKYSYPACTIMSGVKVTFGLLIDVRRMPFFRELHLVRVALQICSVVPDDEGVLMPRQPVLHLKFQQTMLVEVEI
jgi:hypothetical protein